MTRLRARGLFAASILFAALSACGSPPGLLGVDPGSSTANQGNLFSLGENAVGESCRAQEDSRLDEAGLGARTVAIYCGDWRSPSGRVIELDEAEAAGGLNAVAQSGPWREDLGRAMRCGTPTTGRMFNNAHEARYLTCQLAQGGWPSVAVATDVDGRIFVMDGIPAAVSVMEQAAAIMAGLESQGSVTSSSSSPSAQNIEALMGGELFGADDRFRDERLLRVAQYYNAVRDYPTSEQKYRDLLELRQQFLPPDHPGLAEPMLGIALQLSNEQRFVEAAAMFDAVQPLAAGSYDALVEPRYYLYRGMDRGNRGDCEGGLDYVRLAGERLTTIADEGGWRGEDAVLVGAGSGAPIELSLSKLLEARLLFCLSRVREGEAALNDGYSLLRVNELAPAHWRSFFESERASMLSDLRRVGAGQTGFQTAISERQELFVASRPEAIDLLQLGDLEVGRGDVDQALSLYRQAATILLDQGAGVQAPQLWTYLQLLQRLGDERPSQQTALYAEMFSVGQLVQTPLTAQTIQSTAVRLASGDQEVSGLIRQLQDLEAEMFEVGQRLDIETTRPEGYRDSRLIQQLLAQREDLEDRRGELERAVQSAAPTYNQLLQRPVEVARVTGSLRSGEAIIQVLPGFSQSIIFFITDAGTRPVTIEVGEEEFQRAVTELRLGLVPNDDGRLNRYDTRLAHAIYRTILGEFDNDLDGIDHLITVPGGALSSLPFGILVRDPAAPVADFDYRQVAFLARDMSISLLPSVRSFADLRELVGESRASRPFIGFADFQPQEGASIGLEDSCESQQLSLQQGATRLPESAREINVSARAFGAPNAPLITGNDFTESAVQNSDLSDYRVVYFATHGLLPTDLQCDLQPALLTSVGQGEDGGDGFLTASEILDLRLDADLIVLSACNTGGGDGRGGESLSGLARSFFYAGARAMLVSHWFVESDSTVRTMTGMFENLGRNRGMGTAEALQRAQMEIFNQAGEDLPVYWSHPLYWGAFSLVGDGERTIEPGVSI